MKQQTVFEMNIPANAKGMPAIQPDGTYELLWELPNGSYARLLFENGDPVHEMYAKLVALEVGMRQQTEASNARD